MSLEHNLVAKRNTKAVTRLVLIRVVFGIGIIQIGTGWRRGRANHLVVVVIILLFLVVIMWWRWRRSDEEGIILEGRRRGRVFG
jgi:heme A synthase